MVSGLGFSAGNPACELSLVRRPVFYVVVLLACHACDTSGVDAPRPLSCGDV